MFFAGRWKEALGIDALMRSAACIAAAAALWLAWMGRLEMRKITFVKEAVP